MRPRPVMWFLLLAVAPAAHAADSVTTVLIVRHAEKDTAKEDPALTPAGRGRAGALARLLAAARIDGIIASDRRRTLETAAPVARAHGLGIDTLAREGTVEGYARRIAARVRDAGGKTLLVVSHADVIPALLMALGLGEEIEMPDTVYDDLFLLTLPAAGGRPALCRLKYGASSH